MRLQLHIYNAPIAHGIATVAKNISVAHKLHIKLDDVGDKELN
jgi:hypothetical protein